MHTYYSCGGPILWTVTNTVCVLPWENLTWSWHGLHRFLSWHPSPLLLSAQNQNHNQQSVMDIMHTHRESLRCSWQWSEWVHVAPPPQACTLRQHSPSWWGRTSAGQSLGLRLGKRHTWFSRCWAPPPSPPGRHLRTRIKNNNSGLREFGSI